MSSLNAQLITPSAEELEFIHLLYRMSIRERRVLLAVFEHVERIGGTPENDGKRYQNIMMKTRERISNRHNHKN